jgi:hypothetical protein
MDEAMELRDEGPGSANPANFCKEVHQGRPLENSGKIDSFNLFGSIYAACAPR